MKLTFAHDHIFVEWKGVIYSPGRLPYVAWARYLEHFEEVIVLARVRRASCEEEVKALARADGANVRFQLWPAVRGVQRMFRSTRALAQALQEAVGAADAVVSRLPSEIGLKAIRLAKKKRVPFAVEVVGDALHGLRNHGSLGAKAYAPIIDMRMRHAIRKADFALYVTQHYLQERYPCSGVVAAASNVSIDAPTESVREARLTRISSNPRPLVIGFVGTLADSHKGLDTLLEALAYRTLRERFIVQVVGEGDQEVWRVQARNLGVHGQVQFMGALPGSLAVQQWLSSVDVYVQPTKGGEGLPRALIESMSVGCLAFATGLSGVPELLEQSHMFRPNDAKQLAMLLESCSETEDRINAMERNITVARRYAKDVLEVVRRDFFGQLAACARRLHRSDDFSVDEDLPK